MKQLIFVINYVMSGFSLFMKSPPAKNVKRAAVLALVLLAGIFIPVLIILSLIIALVSSIMGRRLQPSSEHTIGQILTNANLTIRWEPPFGELTALSIFTKQPILHTYLFLSEIGLKITATKK